MLEFLLDYLDKSSIHGFGQLAVRGRHPLEQLLWVAVLGSMMAGAALLSWSTWRRFQDNPTVISLEKNYYDWNATLPAMTICPDLQSRVDENFLQTTVNKYMTDENKTLVAELTRRLARLELELQATGAASLHLPKTGVLPADFLPLVQNSSAQFEMHLATSLYGKDLGPWAAISSETGVCYTAFSSVQDFRIINQSKEDSCNNKQILGNLLDGDVFATWEHLPFGGKGYMLSPFEVMDVSSRNVEVKNKSMKDLVLSPKSIVNSERIKGLSVSQRCCRFSDESDLPISPFYTYNLCRIQCRINMALELCSCVPHFYNTKATSVPPPTSLRQGTHLATCCPGDASTNHRVGHLLL